jgi:lipoprotein-anchoring transpeptidase ErfK/SrfK
MKRSGPILLQLVSLAMLAAVQHVAAQAPRTEPVTQVVPVTSPTPLPAIGEAPQQAPSVPTGPEPVSTAAPVTSPTPAASGTMEQPAATPPAVNPPIPQVTATTPAMSATGTAAVPSPTPELHYSIEIDLTNQRAYLLKDGEKYAESPISSGRAGHLTPTGDFEVIEKDLNHFSNLYGKIVEKDSGRVVKAGADSAMPVPKGCKFEPAPMKWFMRFDGAAGMHAGILPGYAASHGCVRMLASKAELFYSLVDVGTPVHVFGTAPAREESEDEPHRHGESIPKAMASPTPKAHHFLWF